MRKPVRFGHKKFRSLGGMRCPLKRNGSLVTGELEGPDDPLVEGAGALKVPFQIDFSGAQPRLRIDGQTYPLPAGEYTPWISVRFRAALGAVRAPTLVITHRDRPGAAQSQYIAAQIDGSSTRRPTSHVPAVTPWPLISKSTGAM